MHCSVTTAPGEVRAPQHLQRGRPVAAERFSRWCLQHSVGWYQKQAAACQLQHAGIEQAIAQHPDCSESTPMPLALNAGDSQAPSTACCLKCMMQHDMSAACILHSPQRELQELMHPEMSSCNNSCQWMPRLTLLCTSARSLLL